MRAGFVEVSEARSDWAPDPKNPLPNFLPRAAFLTASLSSAASSKKATLGRVGIALERAFAVAAERPPSF